MRWRSGYVRGGIGAAVVVVAAGVAMVVGFTKPRPTEAVGQVKRILGGAAELGPVVRDFGEIPQGREVTQLFTLVNKGSETIRVKSVQADCTCTVSSMEQRVAGPGESVDIQVRFNSAGLAGRVHKRVIVDVAGAWDEKHVLAVEGTVQNDQRAMPSFVDLGRVEPGDQVVRRIRVFRYRKDAHIQRIHCEGSFVRASEVKQAVESPYAEVDVQVDVPMTAGKFEGEVSVTFDRGETSPVRVPVMGAAGPMVRCEPGSLFLGMVERGQKSEAVVKVVANKHVGRLSLGVVKASPGITAVVDGQVSEREHRVRVQLDCNQPAGNYGGTVLLKADIGTTVWMELPVRAILRERQSSSPQVVQGAAAECSAR